MDFDTKQKVLIAIYAEYQKDIPEMSKNITTDILGIDFKKWIIALEKLENERLICGTKFADTNEGPIAAFLDRTKMTPYGIQYVETKLKIEPIKTGKEKIQELAAEAANWGWNEAKDILARILSEVIKNSI